MATRTRKHTIARRAKQPPSAPPTPPSWHWRVEPGRGARLEVFKDQLRWAIWDDHPRDEGALGWSEQPIRAFLREGPPAGTVVPDDVVAAARAWCDTGAWRALPWQDGLSLVLMGPRGPTIADGVIIEGDHIDDQMLAARAAGFAVVSDVTIDTRRQVSLARPWRPPADDTDS